MRQDLCEKLSEMKQIKTEGSNAGTKRNFWEVTHPRGQMTMLQLSAQFPDSAIFLSLLAHSKTKVLSGLWSSRMFLSLPKLKVLISDTRRPCWR